MYTPVKLCTVRYHIEAMDCHPHLYLQHGRREVPKERNDSPKIRRYESCPLEEESSPLEDEDTKIQTKTGRRYEDTDQIGGWRRPKIRRYRNVIKLFYEDTKIRTYFGRADLGQPQWKIQAGVTIHVVQAVGS